MTTWTKGTKNTASWSKSNKSFPVGPYVFLIDVTYKFLIDNTYQFSIGDGAVGSVIWNKVNKS